MSTLDELTEARAEIARLKWNMEQIDWENVAQMRGELDQSRADYDRVYDKLTRARAEISRLKAGAAADWEGLERQVRLRDVAEQDRDRLLASINLALEGGTVEQTHGVLREALRNRSEA